MSATAADPTPSERQFLGQPWGLSTLFMTEMWERFSYYGMRALLVLYLTTPIAGDSTHNPGLGLSKGDASAIYGTYVALVYVTPLAGGWIADKLWGAQKSVFWGGVIIAAGHFCMAVPVGVMFWVGLVLIALGTGLLKPNISAIVGDLYDESDARRDAGFSLFYMGINLGAFIAPLVTGSLEVAFGWHVAFLTAGIGMVLGLIQYVLGRKSLGTAGLHPVAPATPEERRRGMAIGVVLALALTGLLMASAALESFTVADVSTALTLFIVALPFIYFTRMLRAPITPQERSRVKAFILLFIAAAVFWGIYDQAGSTLSTFAEDFTNRDLGFFTIPTAWFQSINPIFIIAFAPVFAALWTRLANRAPSLPLKLAIAMVGIGLSFLIMIPPAMSADNGAKSSAWWIIGVYLVQTWAELLLSPTGLSATTQLAPAGYSGQMIALWFLATSVGDSLAGQVLRLMDGQPTSTIFTVFGLMGLAMAVVLFLLIKPMKELMGAGVTDSAAAHH